MVMEDHKNSWLENPTLEEIVEIDEWSRRRVEDLISKVNNIVISR
jgi:hypothetical protein